MSKDTLRQRFAAFRQQLSSYYYAMTLISWDASTEAPKKSADYRARMIGQIYGMAFDLLYHPNTAAMLEEFLACDGLEVLEQRSATEYLKSINKRRQVPQELLVEQQQHIAVAERVWEEAKATSDFAMFAPYLEKSIELEKRTLEYRSHPSGLPYNILLDDFEEGLTIEKYDLFFGALRNDLIPFVRQLHAEVKPIDDSLLYQHYPTAKQRAFVEHLIQTFRFDLEKGLFKVSVHPFTTGTHSQDTRFTVRYLENYLPSSVFAGAHELGHAMHAQQGSAAFDGYMLPFGSAMAESQSRFYENFIARSLPFWEKHFSVLADLFPEQMAGQNPESFWRIVNRSKPSFIRIEADELTYPMHIMLRYEIERDLFASGSSIKVADLPEIWNAKMKEYLGIVPENDAQGVLQDTHWSGGMFGYFPTYALGTAYAAQFYDAMLKDLDVPALVGQDRMEEINGWLADKIHREGQLQSADELMLNVTGGAFNPHHLVQFLKARYSQIYRM